LDMKLQQYIPPPLPGRLNHPGEGKPVPPDREGGGGPPVGGRGPVRLQVHLQPPCPDLHPRRDPPYPVPYPWPPARGPVEHQSLEGWPPGTGRGQYQGVW